ncbi:hypothetical protein K2173_021986 [Erythroxylum novogranatense]|uniref:NAC domain-containing protein n=1 Tax=Erythroxylum novogranatense TaxID=1862640 RepID=A0AAV8T320_9ROSI|nr:hypothetical protein K2173_021986 [Erythroxylum novogranatense]
MSSDLPPGFRFHPTDEELIMYYLRNQATSKPCPVSIIPEVDIYKFDPWQLPEKTDFGENEWYFFSPRDRKYPNGIRPNRATLSGYWKATGTDKGIYSGSRYVGVKKALVFYKGRPPKGIKTEWIMHEYRLNEPKKLGNKSNASMRLDDWVLCRIYKKRHVERQLEDKILGNTNSHLEPTVVNDVSEKQMFKHPKPSSLSHPLEMECVVPISQLLNDEAYNNSLDFQSILANAGTDYHIEKFQLGEMPYRYTDFGKLQVGQGQGHGQGSISNQPLYGNPTFYGFQ